MEIQSPLHDRILGMFKYFSVWICHAAEKKRFLALLQDNKENVTEVITLHPQRKKLKCLIKSFQLILN